VAARRPTTGAFDSDEHDELIAADDGLAALDWGLEDE